MTRCPTKGLQCHLLAGDGLDHIWTGYEHVTCVANHENEVGHCRGIDRTTGARAQDHADLWNDAGRSDIAPENSAEGCQRNNTFLDARSTSVVEADHGRADAFGQVHHLVDLLAEHLAERAAENGEVLAEHDDLAPLDGAPTGDHAVGEGALREPNVVRPMPRQHVELMERTRIE